MKTIFNILVLALVMINASTAQWVQTNGPWGGVGIYFFDLHGDLLVSAYSNGLYRSTDNGASWSHHSLSYYTVNVILAKDGNLFAGVNNGIMRSTNNGFSWNSLGESAQIGRVNALVTDGSDLFAGGNNGVYLSTDNGDSWIWVNKDLPSPLTISCLAISNGNLLCGRYNGVYLSTNRGADWTFIGLEGIADFDVMDNNLFAIASNTDKTSRTVYLSTNNGTNWREINGGLPRSETLTNLVISGSDIYIGVETFYTSLITVYLSTNNGTSWASVTAPLSRPIRALTVHNGHIITATDKGVFLSTDNNTRWLLTGWIRKTGYMLWKDNKLLVGVDNNIWLSTDNGEIWGWTYFPSNAVGIISFVAKDSLIFAGHSLRGVYRSTDNGDSWKSTRNNGLANPWVNILAVTSNYLYAGTKYNPDAPYYLARSSDNGDNWVTTSSGISGEINSLVETEGAIPQTSYFFVGTKSGIYRSTTDGTTWNNIVSGKVKGVATMAGKVFAIVDDDKLLLSIDKGANWIQQGQLPAGSKSLLTISGNNIFFHSQDASINKEVIYLSTNNGVTWSNVGTFSYYQSFYSIIVSDSNVFLALSNGIWKRSLFEMITSVESFSGELVKNFKLQQNYPNPFNPTTTISYSLPQTDWVIVKIYNLLGSKVATLVDEKMYPGNYQVTWDAKDFSSGIYFYHLQAGPTIQVKKMVLIK